jgi:hypothetical protein
MHVKRRRKYEMNKSYTLLRGLVGSNAATPFNYTKV